MAAPLPRSSRGTAVKLHKLGAHSAPGAAGRPRPAGSAESPQMPLAPPAAALSPVLLCSFPGSLDGLLHACLGRVSSIYEKKKFVEKLKRHSHSTEGEAMGSRARWALLLAAACAASVGFVYVSHLLPSPVTLPFPFMRGCVCVRRALTVLACRLNSSRLR